MAYARHTTRPMPGETTQGPLVPSPALQWLTHLWNAKRAPTQAMQRLNMATAVGIAITMRMHFDRDDFVWLATDTRDCSPFGRSWLSDGEWCYRYACEARNTSALRALEHWKNRPPFLWEGKRIYVGWHTWWETHREHIYCTSFAQDGSAVVLCSYVLPAHNRCEMCHVDTAQHGRAKILHRFTFTPEEMRALKPKKGP